MHKCVNWLQSQQATFKYEYSEAFSTNFYIWCCFLCIPVSFGNWETKEFTILTWRPQSHVGILIYRIWPIASGFAYLPHWEKERTTKPAKDICLDMAFKLLNPWTIPFLSGPCFELVSLEDSIHSSGVSGVRKWCFLAICTGWFFE